nr:hypothetical protein [Novosphingobium sp. NBM11]
MNGNQLPDLADRNKERREEHRFRLWKVGAARVEPDIRGRWEKIPVVKVTFAESAPDIDGLVPNMRAVRCSASLYGRRHWMMPVRADSAEFAQNVLAIAPGKARHQDALVALPD